MTDRIPLTEAFDEMFGVLDKHAAKAIEVAGGVSCRKGCAHCCYLLTALTPTEGINIAERLLKDEARRSTFELLLEALRKNALSSSFENLNRSTYFERGIRCAFLTESNECSIYSFRPSMCRYHLVISPPELCSPNAPRDVQTSSIDLTMLEAEVWRLDQKFRDSPVPIVAPISITVLWAMKFIVDQSDMDSDDGKRIKSLVDKAVEGIPSPPQWTMKHLDGLFGEESTKRVPLEQALADKARQG